MRRHKNLTRTQGAGSQAGSVQGAVRAPAHPDTESECRSLTLMPSRKDARRHVPVSGRLLTNMFDSLAGYILESLQHVGGVRPQRANVSLPSALKESDGSVQSQ